MHLLRSNPIPSPEFASLSILLNPNEKDKGPFRFDDNLLLASPLSTVSYDSSIDSIKELHKYLTSCCRSSSSRQKAEEDVEHEHEHVDFINSLLQEDVRFQNQMQIFRPQSCHGIGLHYHLIRETSVIMQIASLIISSAKPIGGKSTKPLNSKYIETEVDAIVLCVGFSGNPMSHSSSSLQYGLFQRFNDCLGVLSRIGKNYGEASNAVNMLLSTLLITEDEHRKSNEMANAAVLTSVPEGATQEIAGAWAALSLFKSVGSSQKSSAESNSHGLAQVSFGSSSADIARAMVERLRVLSVSENDTFLKRYQSSGQARKANLDLTGNKSRFRRKQDDVPDLDSFDYQGIVKTNNTSSQIIHNDLLLSKKSPNIALHKNNARPQQLLRQPKKDTSSKAFQRASMIKLSAPRGQGSRRNLSPGVQTDHSKRNYTSTLRRIGDSNMSTTSSTVNSSTMNSTADDLTSLGSFSTSAGRPRLQINIALNEDLTCSYKASKMTSCNVEGVVQIQLKVAPRSGIPFQIILRDPSGHLLSLQENKKYAEDMRKNAQHGDNGGRSDRLYKIIIPQTSNYFPVLRYKCSQELRPVPIRVQTRVKVDRRQCRVALQISSNPHNEGSLTDLTIIMGVTTEICGETLVTQPVGGVWNAAKRSVIWCVSELGDGEKFQLQAKFDMSPDYPFDDENSLAIPPKFPVLVRCQCMLAQLSDVEVDVRDIPEIFPAEVTMRVARRFRLSHQERS